MPCLSSNADSALNESIRVSNAESQLALPLRMTTDFGASVICSPKGSAVWTAVAGFSAAAGGALGTGEGLTAGAGAGDAGAAGVGAAGVLATGGAAGGD